MLLRKLAGKRILFHTIWVVIPMTAFGVTSSLSALLMKLKNSVRQAAVHDSPTEVSYQSVATHKALATVPLNRHATHFVDSFLKKEAGFLQKMKTTGQLYFCTIEKLLVKQGLPPQLRYLAIVESKLQPTAESPAGARGLWQLMPATAQELGLTINNETDERLHTDRSTAAAAQYLRKLYADFGDWLLVVAAYNSGPGPVYAAIKKAGTRHYWGLQRYLSAESRSHVKRFIGVHYFFEGGGSVVTQTAAEAKAWQKKLGSGMTVR
jgi:membrane-bound lytic murein transglycosylase D